MRHPSGFTENGLIKRESSEVDENASLTADRNSGHKQVAAVTQVSPTLTSDVISDRVLARCTSFIGMYGIKEQIDRLAPFAAPFASICL